MRSHTSFDTALVLAVLAGLSLTSGAHAQPFGQSSQTDQSAIAEPVQKSEDAQSRSGMGPADHSAWVGGYGLGDKGWGGWMGYPGIDYCGWRPGQMVKYPMEQFPTGWGMMGPGIVAIVTAFMDSNGDGSLSLQEVQTIQARLFTYVDTDKDGRATPEEIRTFVQGPSVVAPQ